MTSFDFWNDEWMADKRHKISGLPDYHRQAKVRKAFCGASGWRYNKGKWWGSLAKITIANADWKYRYGILALSSILDHPESYTRGSGRSFNERMMIVHNYGDENPLDRLDGLPFHAEKLPWSWYYPGWCTAWAITATDDYGALKRALDDQKWKF